MDFISSSNTDSVAAQMHNYNSVVISASSIPRHMDFHAMPRNSPFAAEFAACCGKSGITHFLLHSSSSAFELLFNFTIYKTIKAGCCKLIL